MTLWLVAALAAAPLTTWTHAEAGGKWRNAPLLEGLSRKENHAFFAPGLKQIAEATSAGAAPECSGLLGTIDIPTLLDKLIAGQRQRDGLRRLRRLGLTELDSALVCLSGDDKALQVSFVGKLKSVSGLLSGLGPRAPRLGRVHSQAFATIDGWLDANAVYKVVRDDELGGRIVASIEAFSGLPLQRDLVEPLTGDFTVVSVHPKGGGQRFYAELAAKDSKGWFDFFEVASELSPLSLKRPNKNRFGVALQGPALFADLEPHLLHLADREEELTPKWKKHAPTTAAIAAAIDGAAYGELMGRVGVAADTLELLRTIGLDGWIDANKKPPLPKALLGKVGEVVVRIDRQDTLLTVHATVFAK